MISILSESDGFSCRGNLKNICYISRNVNNIFDLFTNNKINEKMENKNYEIITYENQKEISCYSVDMKKKIIINDKDEIILNFSTETEIDDKLHNKKRELIKYCKDLARKKSIPKIEDNYFLLILDIESSNNIKEDIDYLEAIKEELEKYE